MNIARQTKKKNDDRIAINEMVRRTGISRATIYHYEKIGLINRPKKDGLVPRHFERTHLIRLKQIRQLREKYELPLSEIKAVLSAQDNSSADLKEIDVEGLVVKAFEKEKKNRDREVTVKKKQILDAAIELFSKKGFEQTTIDAIANTLNIGKGTIYHYFESKEDLFIECISRLTVIALPKEFWDEIESEKEYFLRHHKRLKAFLTAFPSYSGILTMCRLALTGENKKLSMKARETLYLMAKPIADDFRLGIESGVLRQFNKELVAYMTLACGETLGSLLMVDSDYGVEEMIDTYFDFINYGTARWGHGKGPVDESALLSGEIVDLNEIRTIIKDIRFGKQAFLPGKVGNAEVQIDTGKMKKVKFFKDGTLFFAEVVDKKGEKISIETNEDLLLSGRANYGTYTIQLKNIDSIVFNTP